MQHLIGRLRDGGIPGIESRRLKIITAAAPHFMKIHENVGIPFMIKSYPVLTFHMSERQPVPVQIGPEMIPAMRNRSAVVSLIHRIGHGHGGEKSVDQVGRTVPHIRIHRSTSKITIYIQYFKVLWVLS